MEFRDTPPPPAKRGRNAGRTRWAGPAAELKANAGRWGLLEEFKADPHHPEWDYAKAASNLDQNVKTGRVSVFAPAGSFDSRVEVVDRTTRRVWATYLGPTD